jgi:predicted dehydrogenase
MARRHAEHFLPLDGCELVAGVDLNEERLAAFCGDFGIPRSFGDLDEAIRWGGFDATANVTPDAVHYPTTMRLIEAGKPVFCEKPLAPTYPLALEMTEAAEKRGIVNMVNLRYRGLSVIQMARALVEDGMIGEVRHIDACYLQSWLVGTHWGDWRTEERWLWRLSGAHGSRGVLGDLGIHILDLASYVADQDPVSVHCRLKAFGKAEGDRIGPYGLDANDSFVMSLEFDGGALGVVHASRWATGYANAHKLAVFGTLGALEIFFESETAQPCRRPTRRSSMRCGAARTASRAFAAPRKCSTCWIWLSSPIASMPAFRCASRNRSGISPQDPGSRFIRATTMLRERLRTLVPWRLWRQNAFEWSAQERRADGSGKPR